MNKTFIEQFLERMHAEECDISLKNGNNPISDFGEWLKSKRIGQIIGYAELAVDEAVRNERTRILEAMPNSISNDCCLMYDACNHADWNAALAQCKEACK